MDDLTEIYINSKKIISFEKMRFAAITLSLFIVGLLILVGCLNEFVPAGMEPPKEATVGQASYARLTAEELAEGIELEANNWNSFVWPRGIEQTLAEEAIAGISENVEYIVKTRPLKYYVPETSRFAGYSEVLQRKGQWFDTFIPGQKYYIRVNQDVVWSYSAVDEELCGDVVCQDEMICNPNHQCELQPFCEDSDPDNDPFVRGEVTNPKLPDGAIWRDFSDTCIRDKITEFGCAQNGRLTSYTHDCQEGFMCEEGICIEEIIEEEPEIEFWLVGTDDNVYEMHETIRDIKTFIGEEELPITLANSNWKINEDDFSYQQYLFFDSENGQNEIVRNFVFDGVEADYFNIQNGEQIARYKLEFSEPANSRVTDSSSVPDPRGTYLSDFENTKINLMGQSYDVFAARRPAGLSQGSILLRLMSGSVSDVLPEGETRTYTLDGIDYEITTILIDDNWRVRFRVNEETTPFLNFGETFVFADEMIIGVRSVSNLPNQDASATFMLGAEKLELRDDDVTNGVSDAPINGGFDVGWESIDGAEVIIRGNDDDRIFTISSVEVNMLAEDDYYVGVGEKLSDIIAEAREEKEVLFANNWDFEYLGLDEEGFPQLRVLGNPEPNLIVEFDIAVAISSITSSTAIVSATTSEDVNSCSYRGVNFAGEMEGEGTSWSTQLSELEPGRTYDVEVTCTNGGYTTSRTVSFTTIVVAGGGGD